MNQMSTIACFSIDVNPDGTLNESGPGWNGYQSQALSNLVTRAHAAGDRVVLTVTSFDQSALDQLTSSTSAPSTLATALIGAIRAKNLDGVNLDFEGSGSADQTGLTRLVTQVSTAIHGGKPHYQVTMDTYASSAGDPSSFYDIRALAPAIDGFFVMEYPLNLQSGGSAVSPLTSTMFSDRTAVDQYLAAVPVSKVILGLSYFGIDWPTTDGTLTAQATGPATQLSYGQIMSSGHPIYWDPTTDTAWTSYQVGTQWHETFFEDPTSLYDGTVGCCAQLGWGRHLGARHGRERPQHVVGAPWVLAGRQGWGVGPAVTSQSAPATSTTSTSPTATTPVPSTTSSLPATTVPPSTIPSTVPSTTPSTSTTTTSQPAPAYQYSGDWNGQMVNLTLWSNGAPPHAGAPVGQFTGFSTNDPTTSCLMTGPNMSVEPVVGQSNEYLVVATKPGDCANAVFTFTAVS